MNDKWTEAPNLHIFGRQIHYLCVEIDHIAIKSSDFHIFGQQSHYLCVFIEHIGGKKYLIRIYWTENVPNLHKKVPNLHIFGLFVPNLHKKVPILHIFGLLVPNLHKKST